MVGALISNLTPSIINEARFSYLPTLINLEGVHAGDRLLLESRVPGLKTRPPAGVAGSFPDFSWTDTDR